MINFTLYKRELRPQHTDACDFFFFFFWCRHDPLHLNHCQYVYNPEMMQSLEEMRKMLPELMSAVGMKAGANSLLGSCLLTSMVLF